MQLTHAAIDLNHMRTMQTQAASYRHDMRHHFTYLQALAGTGNLDKIQEYIQTAQSDLDAITPKRFCSNELINLLLSAYDTKAESEGISLLVQASIPAELPLSDTKLCAILSNALENALHASIETEEKFIQVQLAERNQTLLIQISNPFIGTVSFQNGMPVSTQAGHGFGTKNIAAIADSYHGQFQFFAKDEIFTVRVLLPLVET
ncbi:MAG: sensor histidine kinase [Clostridium sp.]|nr:sensor histidine kinase [Clostridium sp.]